VFCSMYLYLHLFSDSEAYHEQMGPIPISNGSLDIGLSNAHNKSPRPGFFKHQRVSRKSMQTPFVHGRLQNLKTSEDIFGHYITPLIFRAQGNSNFMSFKPFL